MTETDQRTNPARRIRGLDADERREQRRQAVLDAALQLFSDQGYFNTSIEQLCQAAFVSTRSFYDLFKGREDCYHALYRQLTAAMEQEMVDRLAVLPDDEEETTRLLIDSFLDVAFRDTRRALVLWGSSRAITPDVDRMRRETREWSAAFLDGIWARYGVSGDNHAIAVALIGGIYDLMTVWLVDGDAEDPNALGELKAHCERFYRAVRRGL